MCGECLSSMDISAKASNRSAGGAAAAAAAATGTGGGDCGAFGATGINISPNRSGGDCVAVGAALGTAVCEEGAGAISSKSNIFAADAGAAAGVVAGEETEADRFGGLDSELAAEGVAPTAPLEDDLLVEEAAPVLPRRPAVEVAPDPIPPNRAAAIFSFSVGTCGWLGTGGAGEAAGVDCVGAPCEGSLVGDGVAAAAAAGGGEGGGGSAALRPHTCATPLPSVRPLTAPAVGRPGPPTS